MFNSTQSLFTSVTVNRSPRSKMGVYNGTSPNRPLSYYAKIVNSTKSLYGPKWHPSFPLGPSTLPPVRYEMLQVIGPFYNRNVISKFLANSFTIYLWCYISTGVCLVGQSTQRQQWTRDNHSGYVRIAHYFDDITLRTQLRGSTEFFYYYGFNSVSLTMLRIDPNVTSCNQVSQMEQYFIDHLYSGLNAQLNVINAKKTTTIMNAKQSLLMHASGKSKPVFIYNRIGSMLLDTFNSRADTVRLFDIAFHTLLQAIRGNSIYLDTFLITDIAITGAITNKCLSIKSLVAMRGSLGRITTHINNKKYSKSYQYSR